MYNVVTEQSSLEEIKEAFAELNKKMEELESIEPKDEGSEEYGAKIYEPLVRTYEAWEKECEELAFRSETLMTWIDHKMTAGL